ncbi:hypothetical protein V8E53_010456 [Lactarius tabidus]
MDKYDCEDSEAEDGFGTHLVAGFGAESQIQPFGHTIHDHTPFADGNEYSPEETSAAEQDTADLVDAMHTTDAINAGLNAAHTTDSVDAADADLLEEMSNNPLSSANPNQDPPVEAQTASLTPPFTEPQSPALAPAQSTEPNTNNLDTSPQVHKVFGDSVWAPFHSQCDWEIACWAKMHGPSSSAMEELLAIPEVVDKLGLLFSSTKKLNQIIDTALPGRPPFECRSVVIGDETLELHFWNILECVCSLYGDPEFAQDLAVAPERHYADQEQTTRIYSEMNTGDWWWAVQTTLESNRPGATVIPVIISSDKTQLTLFRGKTAYPVYLTIGNIPKAIRQKPSHHAQILVAYIPTTKLEGITNKSGRRRALANLYHSCMKLIMSPITAYGETGIPMMSRDGIWHRCHPIYAIFVGDYPEQTLVTCTHNNRCPKCVVPYDQLGSYNTFLPCNYDEARDAHLLSDGDAGQKPVFYPFWESLPLTNVFISIAPDILHQLLQGVFKTLVGWLIETFGASEIDMRCRSIPPNHHISIFARGISPLSRITGKEHKNMSCILLGLVLDLPVPNGQVSPHFLFLAQLPSHLSHTLARLEDSLSRFHNNKEVFVDLGICNHFKIPKIHSLLHYTPSIRLFGTTDNYNTEQTERLHIDTTKDAFGATNHKDEYSQMTTWVEHREKVQRHSSFIKWRQQGFLWVKVVKVSGSLEVR